MQLIERTILRPTTLADRQTNVRPDRMMIQKGKQALHQQARALKAASEYAFLLSFWQPEMMTVAAAAKSTARNDAA